MDSSTLQEMLDAVPQAVVAVDGEGRVAGLNRAARAAFPLSAEGRPWREALPIPLHAEVAALLADPAAGAGPTWAVQPRPGGGAILAARPPAGAASCDPLLESVPAIVLVAHDAACRQVTGNGLAAELLRCAPGENLAPGLPGRSDRYRVLRGGREVSPESLPLRVAAAEGTPIQGAELDFLYDDGTSRRIYGNAVPLRDAAGRPCGAVAAFVDITARSRADLEARRLNETLEERVRQRTAALQEANMQLESFCYSVSHDLRAPLRTVVGMAELLQQEGKADPAAAAEYVRRIDRAGRRMDALIRDLLLYSQIALGDLRLSEIDLGALVARLLHDLDDEHRHKGAEVAGAVPPGLRVRGIPTALQQALTNLLGNAVKFVPPGERARVRVEAAPGPADETPRMVRCAVSDNGIGVPEEYRHRVFNLFERLHRNEEYAGTGIGLSIARRAVERMGGRIGCEPNPGHPTGMRFWIELPMVGD